MRFSCYILCLLLASVCGQNISVSDFFRQYFSLTVDCLNQSLGDSGQGVSIKCENLQVCEINAWGLPLQNTSVTIPSGFSQLSVLVLVDVGLASISSLPSSLVQLDLSDNSLKTFPDVSGLSNLETLNLSHNQLPDVGDIVYIIGGVNHLYLHENNINCTLDFLSSATSLQILNMSSNQLIGTVPSSINNLTNLRQVMLSNNTLNGTIPNMSSLNLTTLNICQNQFQGSFPVSLLRNVNLKTLYLDDNQFSGTLPASLSNLAALSELSLSSNLFYGTIPDTVSSMTLLKKFYAADTFFFGSPPIFSPIQNITVNYSLTCLDVADPNAVHQPSCCASRNITCQGAGTCYKQAPICNCPFGSHLVSAGCQPLTCPNGTNGISCSGNGNCNFGLCACSAGYSGPACDQQLLSASPSTQLIQGTSGPYCVLQDLNDTVTFQFNVSMLRIYEFSPSNGNTIVVGTSYPLVSTPVINKTRSDYNYYYYQQTISTATILITWYHFKQPTMMTFVGKTQMWDTGTVKIMMTVSGWKFASANNLLGVDFLFVAPSCTGNQSLCGYQTNEVDGVLYSLLAPADDARTSSLYATFNPDAEIDGYPSSVLFSVVSGSNGNLIRTNIPSFRYNATFDPNIGVLLAPAAQGASHTNSPSSSNMMLIIEIVAPVAGFIVVAGITLGIVCYLRCGTWRARMPKDCPKSGPAKPDLEAGDGAELKDVQMRTSAGAGADLSASDPRA